MGRKIAPTSDAEEIMAMMKLWASTTKDERGDIRKERMKRRFRAETGKELYVSLFVFFPLPFPPPYPLHIIF